MALLLGLAVTFASLGRRFWIAGRRVDGVTAAGCSAAFFGMAIFAVGLSWAFGWPL
ncbi:hypothetical protein [Thermocatellispora tengchongensis]|uniref:hypothetical protein n=1 Tax=Thermocatellispora tengchongensis TaxID=1073253 RepID=UPI003637E8ED